MCERTRAVNMVNVRICPLTVQTLTNAIVMMDGMVSTVIMVRNCLFKLKSLKDTNSEIDHCSPNPCFNGAECINGNNHYECRCKPGFDGPECRHS